MIFFLLMIGNLIHAYPFDYSLSSFYSPAHHDFGMVTNEGKHSLPIEEHFKRGQGLDLQNGGIRGDGCRSILTPDCQNYIKDSKNIIKIVRRAPIWATDSASTASAVPDKRPTFNANENWLMACKKCGLAMVLRDGKEDRTSQAGPEIEQMNGNEVTAQRKQQKGFIWSKIRVLKKDSIAAAKDESSSNPTYRKTRATPWRRIRVMKRM